MKRLGISIVLICLFIGGVSAQQINPQEEILPPQHETAPQQKEGREKLSEIELPDLVQQAFDQSEYQGMSITEVYRLSGNALDDIIATTQGPKPEVLYEIHVASANHITRVYITEEGTFYDVAKKV